jgi:hypothetical protein
LDKDTTVQPEEWTCRRCNSPCAACEGSADTCLTCDGSKGRQYLWEGQCWQECPDGTAPDLSTQKCVACGPNCKRCSIQDGGSCHECKQPYLLDLIDGVGECVETCQPGYRPDRAGTNCINKPECLELGAPIFAIMMAVIFVAVVIVKYCFKKETEIIPSLIASISVVEFFAILFQIWMCTIFRQPRYLGFTLFAFGVLVVLNIYNLYYIKTNVASRDARKQEKLS